MDNSDYDVILLAKPEVFVYKIPPRQVQGHIANDWKECIWQGKLELKSVGAELSLRLIDIPTNKLYAECPIPQRVEQGLERCIDSSRYFAARVVSGKRHAFIGIGFESRNDAFDLNAAINDFYKRQTAGETISMPTLSNLKLKDNEQIVIQIGASGQTVTSVTTVQPVNESKELFTLQPPPCESRSRGINFSSSPQKSETSKKSPSNKTKTHKHDDSLFSKASTIDDPFASALSQFNSSTDPFAFDPFKVEQPVTNPFSSTTSSFQAVQTAVSNSSPPKSSSNQVSLENASRESFVNTSLPSKSPNQPQTNQESKKSINEMPSIDDLFGGSGKTQVGGNSKQTPYIPGSSTKKDLLSLDDLF
eukprot:GDKJ01031535.1.p1 GENE.GDKJ01031535.1~~GDKJ01031535.1.p1  ORF type:complete len:369 (-),score=91.35 GDKJ01031535.1:66-1151(-)